MFHYRFAPERSERMQVDMKLKEVSEIEKCTDEDKPIKILEEIGDKVIFKGYQEEQVIRKYKTQQKSRGQKNTGIA